MARLLLFLLLTVSLAACGTPPSPAPPEARSSPRAGVARAELRPVKREGAVVHLTASDGTGLELVVLQARAVVQGPLAFTELHMTFQNPQDRVLEGRFEITLPPGAAVSRLAMKLDQGWQEAEVVELGLARQAYEDFLHRRQDPALLEKQAGNQFQARIFPIPAGGQKEIILSYSQELTADQPYSLPLAGLPRLRSLEVEALVGLQSESLRISRQGQAPEGDFVVEPGDRLAGLVNQDLALVCVRPEFSVASEPPRQAVVLVDTSASRAAGWSDQLQRVEQVLRGLGDLPVQVAAFDQGVAPVYEGPARGFTSSSLSKREPLGATDVEAALNWAAGRKGADRVLLFSDSVSTCGEAHPQAALKALRGAGVERLDVILVGGIRDADAARMLTAGALPRPGAVLDGDRPAEELCRRLALPVLAGVPVSVPGAKWLWPERLPGLQPGDEALVYLWLDKPVQTVRVELGAPLLTHQEVALSSVSRPMLERAAVQAQIARLTQELAGADKPEQQAKLRASIVDLSTRYRVLSDLTGLLVLETDQDYARFGIDRKALADILVVGPQGLEVQRRTAPVVQTPVPVGRGPEVRDRSLVADSGSEAEIGSAAGSEAGSAPAPLSADRAPARSAPGARGAFASPVPDSNGPYAMESAERRVDGNDAQPGENARLDPEAARTRPEPALTRRATGGLSTATEPESENPVAMEEASEETDSDEGPEGEPAYTGRMADLMGLLSRGKQQKALEMARAWHREDPGDVVALVALGEALEACGQSEEAARAYGSLIDLFPGRADLRRYAGCRLERLGRTGQGLAVDTFQRAAEQRPDHVASHRLLAFALLRQGHPERAFEALEKGIARDYPPDRFAEGKRILREDLGLVAAAWLRQDPARKSEVLKRLQAAGSQLPRGPSTRCVLTWETDANDVDFHVYDARGGHAWYDHPHLPSGGDLYADVTTGYGPECFAIQGRPAAYPYHLKIHYYSRGPMGYGMGKVEVVEHDGKGGLHFSERPFLVMNDEAYVDLGTLAGPLK